MERADAAGEVGAEVDAEQGVVVGQRAQRDDVSVGVPTRPRPTLLLAEFLALVFLAVPLAGQGAAHSAVRWRRGRGRSKQSRSQTADRGREVGWSRRR